MNAAMTYTENTKKVSSACSSVGRPIKGFEKWRLRALEAEPITFPEFLKGSFEKIEEIGGVITLGFVENGTWTDYTRGANWNYVRVNFEGKEPKYRSLGSFEAEYSEYVEKFHRRQARIAAGL